MIGRSVSNREKGLDVRSSSYGLYQPGCEYDRPRSGAIDEPLLWKSLTIIRCNVFWIFAASMFSIKESRLTRLAHYSAAISVEILLIR
jgi:hypothetical protein